MNLMCIISLYNYWSKGFISSSLWKIILLSNDECTLTKRFKSNSTKAVALIPYLFFYSKWANWKWEHTSLEQTRLAGLLGLPSEPLHSHSSQPARPLGSNWASPLDAALLDTCWEHSMQWAIGMRIQKVWKPWMLLLLLGNLQCSPARCVLWNCRTAQMLHVSQKLVLLAESSLPDLPIGASIYTEQACHLPLGDRMFPVVYSCISYYWLST